MLPFNKHKVTPYALFYFSLVIVQLNKYGKFYFLLQQCTLIQPTLITNLISLLVIYGVGRFSCISVMTETHRLEQYVDFPFSIILLGLLNVSRTSWFGLMVPRFQPGPNSSLVKIDIKSLSNSRCHAASLD